MLPACRRPFKSGVTDTTIATFAIRRGGREHDDAALHLGLDGVGQIAELRFFQAIGASDMYIDLW